MKHAHMAYGNGKLHHKPITSPCALHEEGVRSAD